MATTITGISSMATRQLLADLLGRYRQATGQAVAIEAVGGVDAAKRVRAGEAFDLVILAENVIEQLEGEGHLVAGSRAAFVRSPMAMAVRAGAPKPAIADPDAVKDFLMNAATIGYSTGPSGTHLVGVLKSWGLDDPARLVQAKPGIPVASLVADGTAAVGIQQLSELMGAPGIEIVGVLPPPVQSVTMFSIGIGIGSPHVADAQAVIADLTAPETIDAKHSFGMEPA